MLPEPVIFRCNDCPHKIGGDPIQRDGFLPAQNKDPFTASCHDFRGWCFNDPAQGLGNPRQVLENEEKQGHGKARPKSHKGQYEVVGTGYIFECVDDKFF